MNLGIYVMYNVVEIVVFYYYFDVKFHKSKINHFLIYRFNINHLPFVALDEKHAKCM